MNPEKHSTIWAFDLGKGSIGEAVRQGNKFLHKASLLIPADFAETKTAAVRRRMFRTRQAHKAREAWLDKVMEAAGIEPLKGRRTLKVNGKWQPAPETDAQKKNRELLEREFAKPGDPTCYTSCLLRIKLLRGEKLEPWQIYKALHSAIQKRGYGKVPWSAKEAARQGMTPKQLEDKEQADLEKKDPSYKAVVEAWPNFKKTVADSRFHFPCYYDAAKMKLWNPANPDTPLAERISHEVNSTRKIRFERSDVEREIVTLGDNAAMQLPKLRAVFEKFKQEGWLVTDKVSGQNAKNGEKYKKETRVRRLKVLAKTIGEFLCYGPAGKAYAVYDPAIVKDLEVKVVEHPDAAQNGKQMQLHRGTSLDWLGAVGQKIPRFDNRIVEQCALIPRLNVCRLVPRWRKAAEGKKIIDPRTLLAAEGTFLLQLKNLQVDDISNRVVRFLKASELKEWIEVIHERIRKEPLTDGWESKVLECFKITKPQWKDWCKKNRFEPIGVERAESQEEDSRKEKMTQTVHSQMPETQKSSGKSKDVVKSPKPNGRSRFSRPALAILRHIILHEESPIEFTKRLRSQGNEKLLDELGFDLTSTPPQRISMKNRLVKMRDRPWIFLSDLDFLGLLWKPTDDKGNAREYTPNQLRIPDMALRYLCKAHQLTKKPFSELLQDNDREIDRRKKAILELIGEQNNPIVRDRLTQFWRRILHFQSPILSANPKKQKPGLGLKEPECLVLELVRDDKDNSLEGQKRAQAYQDLLTKNEERREKARKALIACGLPTSDDMVARWLLLDSQGPFCIYTNQNISCSDLPNLQIEHIVPRSLGGPDAYWNWVLCSEDANNEKGNRVPFAWFKEEKTEDEWNDYKKRVRDRQGRLGARKADLLLRADAAELVGEKYTSLADTAWIARVAQSVARLHFGWPLDDEPAKEKVVTISGGLTARIRRKYLLDSLLGGDEEVVENRQSIDAVLVKLETQRFNPEFSKDEREQWKDLRGKLRQELSRLAKETDEKNRDDKRHHALDAMLLTFLPNWARDRNKKDFFRFEDIGDAPLYSEKGKQETAIIQKEIKKLSDETSPVREQIQAAKKRGDAIEMQRLKEKIFPQRKRMAQCFQNLERLKQPRNIHTVREWFRQQIEGDGETIPRILPRRVARENTPVEATFYRRVYVVDTVNREAKTIPLTTLASDPHDENKTIFDLKWLRARIQSIAEDKSYDKKKLKTGLSARLTALLVKCETSKHNITIKDWQNICSDAEIQALFTQKGDGNNTMSGDSSKYHVKVFKVKILPAKRYPLVELAYASGTTYSWNQDHFQEQNAKIIRKLDQRRAGLECRQVTNVPHLLNPADASPWDGFVFDRDIQAKLNTNELRQEIITKLAPLLVPSGLESDEREKKKKIWKQVWNDFCLRHQLPKSIFLYEATAAKPPRRPSTPLMSIMFERKEKIFSAKAVSKQAKSVVDSCLGRCLICFADSLLQIPEQQREFLWKKFCDAVRITNIKDLEGFTSINSTPTAERWISFFEKQTGPRVFLIEQIAGKSLGEYYDLSKDGTGVFAKGDNQGYWICQRNDKIEGHPIRFFESKATIQKRLADSGWKLLDPAPWHSGDLFKLSKPAGTPNKTIQPGYYFLGSISNKTSANLNTCFGGDVPQGISLQALWQAELRPV